MWWEENTLLHQDFAKPMASRSVVMARSAFSTTTKRNILVEEGFLDNLSISMMEGGHTEHFRVTVFMRVLGKYENNLTNHLQCYVFIWQDNTCNCY